MHHTFRFVQLASFICAICVDGVNELVLPNGDGITVDTVRFSFDGVLLNEKARPTCNKNVFNFWYLNNCLLLIFEPTAYLKPSPCRKFKGSRQSANVDIANIDTQVFGMKTRKTFILQQG